MRLIFRILSSINVSLYASPFRIWKLSVILVWTRYPKGTVIILLVAPLLQLTFSQWSRILASSSLLYFGSETTHMAR